MRDYDERLRELGALGPGWLGADEGRPVAPAALGAARRLLAWVEQEGLPDPWIYPTPDGGVSLEWEHGIDGVTVEVTADGYEVGTAATVEATGCAKRVHVLLRDALGPPSQVAVRRTANA